jgi:ethanolaminephosphotransferase
MRVDEDRQQLLYRNAIQMKKIVETKFSSLRFDEKTVKSKDMGSECAKVSTEDDAPRGFANTKQNLGLTDGQSLACTWHEVMKSLDNPSTMSANLYKVCEMFFTTKRFVTM